MSRVAKHSVSVFGLALVVLLLPILMRMTAPSAVQGQGPAMPTIQVQADLIRAGLDPASLAAAGVSSNQTTTLVGLGKTLLTSEPTRLSDADAAATSARVTHDTLERKIQSGLATEQELTDYASATSALASAESDCSAALASIFSAATASLSEDQRSLLSTIQGNRKHTMPIEFLAVNRSESQWLALRKALANERVSAANGDTPNATCQTLLSTERANETVAAAKSASVANLSSVKSAWNSATSN